MKRLLIANRGEIAVRIARAAAELGLESCGVFTQDDARSGHVFAVDRALALEGVGPRGYLDVGAILRAAATAECDALHPGYGFLSEDADFARRCFAAGLKFVGPRPEALELFGDKARSRRLADELGVPILRGTAGATDLEAARRFLRDLGPGGAVMLKPVSGGGGRGMRVVRAVEELDEAFRICALEARGAFGREDVYVEELVERVRHVEVQVVGDRSGAAIVLGDRDCSAQRSRQKLIEIAPAPGLSDRLRAALAEAAQRIAQGAGYDSVGTMEFLVDLADPDGERFVFIEANPRLQVEHTVTEEVTGIDLVQTQIRIAAGETLGAVGLGRPPVTTGCAVQLRINAEAPAPGGGVQASGGVLSMFAPPGGPGVRVDTHAYPGMPVSPAYDSLLAKLIVRTTDPSAGSLLRRARHALRAFQIEGVATNQDLLLGVIGSPELEEGRLDTDFVEARWAEVAAGGAPRAPRYPAASGPAQPELAAILATPGDAVVVAPIDGVLVALDVAVGDPVWVGRPLATVEAMKMQHVVSAERSGVVRALAIEVGGLLQAGAPVLFLSPAEVCDPAGPDLTPPDPTAVRPDLQHVLDRHALTLDEARPQAMARRRAAGRRTARENLADLFDPASFHEYGALAIAAQRRRRPVDELMATTPADGIVGGVGTVNADLFGADQARCVALSYDFTVMAGTQGIVGHKKTDRIVSVAHEMRAPVVFFTEGGGGRPGDVDFVGVCGLDSRTFELFGAMSGVAPRIGVAAGRCFAGNAVLFGSCDLTIATEGSSIGLAGPALIEGGGLGVFRPDEIGPVDVQARNGSIDLRVADEAEAVRQTRRLLSYFQGAVGDWACADQTRLRAVVPEHRQRAYDIGLAVDLIADSGSTLELRAEFGRAIRTFLIRIEGRAMGVIANNPHWLGGAVDADGSDKAARFLQLCEAFGLPVISLIDTPGFMVGPAAEAAAGVRHGARLFVAGAALTVPLVTVILRKGYGLGAMAMSAGSFHKSVATLAWPTGEFGGMGFEGAVKLGYRRELDAIDDPAAKEAFFQARLSEFYETGRATSVAQFVEIDAVIDPADTRAWIVRVLRQARTRPPGPRRFVDTW